MDAKENKRLVMEGYEMFQRGDIPRLLERYHDDALWIEPESETVPFAGRHQGKAEIARFSRSWAKPRRPCASSRPTSSPKATRSS
jgi:ketosteroid isomerase-like protein